MTDQPETFQEQLDRVVQMSLGDSETWDLSDNDCAALEAVLTSRAALVEENQRLKLSLGRCYQLAGADTDGNESDELWRHAEYAEAAVEDLKRDYDSAIQEIPSASSHAAQRREVEAVYREMGTVTAMIRRVTRDLTKDERDQIVMLEKWRSLLLESPRSQG